MSKEWFIKEGGQVCLKADNGELNGWDIQSLVDCLNGKEIKIADLKAKLAESEKHNAWVLEFLEKCKIDANSTPEYSQNPIIEYLEQVSDFRAVECEELKQQLAEKEKEIEYLDKSNKLLRTVWDVDEQNKIMFAVEQLEKVKEKIQEDRESLINYNNTSEVLMADGFLCDCKNFIDNQINELKEMK